MNINTSIFYINEFIYTLRQSVGGSVRKSDTVYVCVRKREWETVMVDMCI